MLAVLLELLPARPRCLVELIEARDLGASHGCLSHASIILGILQPVHLFIILVDRSIFCVGRIKIIQLFGEVLVVFSFFLFLIETHRSLYLSFDLFGAITVEVVKQ